jgi:hypothetical protein
MEDIHEQVWICTDSEGDGVRAYMVKMYLQVEMYTILDDFIQINESGIKKLHVSISFLYNNVCINFVTYKFCYRITNVCINFVTV